MIGPAIGDDELHALADGRLDPVRRAEVEAWLATNPEAASRVAFYGRLNADLHRRFDAVLDEKVPMAMTPPPGRRWFQHLARAAVAASLLLVGAFGGWTLHERMIPRSVVERPAARAGLASQAAMAHAVFAVEVRHPVEVAAAEEAHLVAWLSNRIGHKVRAPELIAAGYHLMGGRLLPAAEGGVAAQFMYENAAGDRVTLFVKPAEGDSGETAFRYVAAEKGVGVFYWLDSRLGYALSGGLERDVLLRLARLVYEQLNG